MTTSGQARPTKPRTAASPQQRLDPYEQEILSAYEAGALPSLATPADMNDLRSAARASSLKDRRVNIRLSSSDLQDLQARALQEGMPYQTLIASVLHKYVSGRFEERAAPPPPAKPRG